MLFHALIREARRHPIKMMAADTPSPGLPAIAPVATASPDPRIRDAEGSADRP